MSTSATTNPLTVEQRIAALRAEADEITAAADGDGYRAAGDLDAWHVRQKRRERRSLQIEQDVRDLQQWGALIDTHAGPIGTYTQLARPIAKRNSCLIEYGSCRDHLHHDEDSKAVRAVEQWWKGLSQLARALPHDTDEQARASLTREADQWFRFRTGILVNELVRRRIAKPPLPELGIAGVLPDWLRYGASRTDRGEETA